MAAATKKKRKEEANPWKAGASSGHITNLKQSILETFDFYGLTDVTLTDSQCLTNSDCLSTDAKNLLHISVK
jgi:hypothetical protein